MGEPFSLIGHPVSGRVFVLGAGFSHYLSGGRLPLLRQLALELQASVSWLASRGGPQPGADIERVLTDLDLDLIGAQDDVHRDELRRLRTELVTRICERLVATNLPAATLESATTLCMKLFSAGDYILTFNWDCLLEQILMKAKAWKPYDGYGWSMSFPQDAEGGRGLNPFCITVLKLHGSVNFRRSTYGGEHLQAAPFVGDAVRPEHSQADQRNPHPPLLTLPTYVKQFAEHRGFIYIWREAIEAIARAEVLIVVGYSLPQADALARLLLSFAGTSSPLKRVAVLNWSLADCEHIREQLREVATLSRASLSFQETVEWNLFPAESEGAYDSLLGRLSEWPKGDMRTLAGWVANRAAFPEMLDLLEILNRPSPRRRSVS